MMSKEKNISLEELAKRNADLENLVAQQNKELEIEAALERVRARSLAMHKSNELNDVVAVLFEKIKELKIPATAVGIGTCIPDSKDLDAYVCGENEEGLVITNYRLPYFDNIISKDLSRALEEQSEYFEGHYSKEEKDLFYEYLFEHSAIKDVPEDIKQMIFNSPAYTISMTAVKNAVFNINDFEGKTLSESEINIIKRFAKVFDQAYTRFLDLQKAEAQAREAQIESTLEQVRSRSLAMHKSEELNEVVRVLFESLNKLQIESTAVAIQTFTEGSKDMQVFVCGDVGTGLVVNYYLLPYFDHSISNDYLNAYTKKLDSFVGTYSKEEKDSFYDVVLKLPELKGLPTEVENMIRQANYYSVTMFPAEKSILGVNDFQGNPLSDSQVGILQRFAKVFDQAYTRFLDLQKAEAQAREAQIEVALEKVRAQAMAMHNSEDMGQCILKMFSELTALGVDKGTRFGIGILNDDNENNQLWTAIKEGEEINMHIGNLDMSWHPLLQSARKAWKAQVPLHKYVLEGEDLLNYYKMINEAPDYKLQVAIEKLPEREIHYGFIFSHGFFYAFCPNEFRPELIHITQRFSSLFSQTYTRFLDLQKAEQQTREAEINLAVERVRARALSMFKSEEILQVAFKLKEEIMGLNIPGVAAATILLQEKNGLFRNWDITSIEQQEGSMHLPLDITFDLDKTHPDFYLRKVWEEGNQYAVVTQDVASLAITTNWLREHNYQKEADEADVFIKEASIEKVYHPTIPLNKGRMCIDLINEPEKEVESILKKMGAAFDLAYKRFEDLQNSEAQLRESQIEAALERVRSKSMAMQQSTDLLEVAHVMFQQVVSLGVKTWNCGLYIWEEDKKFSRAWNGLENGVSTSFQANNSEDVFRLFYEASERGEPLYVIEMDEDVCADHYQYMKSIPDLKEGFEHIAATGLQLPEQQIIHAAFFQYGYLMFITYEPVPDMWDTFQRCAKVFEQTYIRFLDLQKAEAQAREAQIELSLERVRAQVTAMQESSDLFDIVVIMRREFLSLGHQADYFWHMRWLPASYDMSMTSEDGNRVGMVISIPKFIHEAIPGLDAWEKGNEPIYVLPLNADAAWEYIDNMNTYGYYEQADPDAPSQEDIQRIGGLTFIMARTTHGEIGYSLPGEVKSPPADALETLERFAGVFDLAYKRFEDLKASEHQRRESQIELSLERIRGQVASMRESQELLNIVVNMRSEFVALNQEAHYFWYMRWLEDTYEKAMTSGDGTQIGMVMSLPRRIHGDIPLVADWEKGNEPILVFPMEVDTAVDYIHKMVTWGDFERLDPQAPTLDDIRHIGGLTFIMARTTHGEIGFSLPGVVSDPPKESIHLLSRFAKVFDLAYSRFEDLKNAEAQTRETQIELALEKVRSRTMGMQKSEELGDVATVLFNELNFLVDNLWTCGFVLCEENTNEDEWWLSMDTGFTRGLFLPNVGDFAHESLYEGWKKSESFRTVTLEGAELQAHYDWLMDIPVAQKTFEDMEASGIPRPSWQRLHAAYFKTGYLVIITEVPCGEVDVFQRFAQVFDLTYTRFLDLQQKEEQGLKLIEEKIRLENTLKELKATQAQLIQSEKLASLGELTAGIAHEIQNPLNFVNNFSEVSTELVDEMLEELKKGDTEEVEAISMDLKQNLEKILHHGKRAQGIVSGMLEHSRASSGEKKPTDLNALADEYLRLSYHGLRAKDKSFNADFETDLAENLPKVEVVSQDIGRVLLNMINNAFYAVNEKSKLGIENYKPKVSLSTKLIDNQIEIKVQDNGTGMPDSVKEKIFQPFFTTKPTGQGTGLGLSLSYDIIKTHRGSLEVESKEGEGTEFVIQLLITD